MKTIFITGISSGIGKAAAVAFLNRGDYVIGTVRDEKSVSELSAQYPDKIILIKIDLSKLDQISEIPNFLQKNKVEYIDILINNAGVAVAAPFQFQNFSEITEIIQINVLSLLKLTQVLIPFIQKSTDGRIINITSVSGVNGTPFLAAYCASKHAVEGFSESLRRELNIYGIKVMIIGPGSVQTPIWDKGFDKIKELYNKTIYKNSFEKFISFAMNEKENALAPEIIVNNILQASLLKKPKIRYSPVPNPIQNFILSILPKRIQDQINYKFLSLKKQ